MDAAKVELARSGDCGARVMPFEGLAARLAGGFLAPIEPQELSRAVGGVLDGEGSVDLGDLEGIRALPGVRKTLADTLRKAWRAGLDLEARAAAHPRLAALARVEAAVLARLRPDQLRPADLVARALDRLRSAPEALREAVGTVELRGFPDLERCWRPLLLELPTATAVAWDAGPFEPPPWLAGTGVAVRRADLKSPAVQTVSCATPRHEVVEALRWARALLANGRARPQDIAFAAASTAPFDDFMVSLAEEANLPVHFAHGRSALHTREGQAAAALADVLVRGLSQERVRRLVPRAGKPGSPLERLPDGWVSALPSEAPLRSAALWRRALAGKDKGDIAAILLPVVELLERGPEAAHDAGELLLGGAARALWRRALAQAPGGALDRELSELRVAESVHPAAAIGWMPASSLASCPRPFVWLLGLNAQSWPRPSREDPLLPDRVLGGFALEEVSVSDADRRSFAAVAASSGSEVVRSFSRREARGRLLGVSPLVAGEAPELRYRSRVPEHAMSEPDRLMARPGEFSVTPAAVAADDCWRAWRSPEITRHDGRVRPGHPAILGALARPQSAHSLVLLLRNPIGFMWDQALGMKAPEMEDEPVALDARGKGTLVHEILERSLLALERDREGLGGGDPPRALVERVVAREAAEVGERWAAETAVPPAMLWNATLRRAEAAALNALLFPLSPMPGRKSYAEVPFGGAKPRGASGDAPWDIAKPVPVPGTGLTIAGRIDRVDVSEGRSTARVVDYKSGKRRADGGDAYVLRGGRELQRCLYAYAVKELLGGNPGIDAGLLYPSATPGVPEAGRYDTLHDPDGTLDRLTEALAAAADNLRNGLALPGVAAGARPNEKKPSRVAEGERDDLAFALPVVPGTMLGPKKEAARALLGTTVASFWDET